MIGTTTFPPVSGVKVLNHVHPASVNFLKQKLSAPWEIDVSLDDLLMFENMSDLDIEKIHQSQIDELKKYVLERSSIHLDI